MTHLPDENASLIKPNSTEGGSNKRLEKRKVHNTMKSKKEADSNFSAN